MSIGVIYTRHDFLFDLLYLARPYVYRFELGYVVKGRKFSSKIWLAFYRRTRANTFHSLLSIVIYILYNQKATSHI
jgi:hypothetical protein